MENLGANVKIILGMIPLHTSVNPATLEDIKLSIFNEALLNCENGKTAIRRVSKPIHGLMKLLNQK